MNFTRDIIYLVVIALLLALCGQVIYSYEVKPSYERRISVYYNKEVEANTKLIRIIEEADEFIYFAIYTFTRTDIQDALLAAKYRGLEVKGVIDKTQIARLEDQRKLAKQLTDAGIPIITQDHSAIMHLKTLVTEKAYFTGSYNWTMSGTSSNDEVIEIGYDDDIRRQYLSVLKTLFLRYE